MKGESGVCPVCRTPVHVGERFLAPSVLACLHCLRLLEVSNPRRPRGVTRLTFRTPRVPAQDCSLSEQERSTAQDLLDFTQVSVEALLQQAANPARDLYALQVLADMARRPSSPVLGLAGRQTLVDLTTVALHLARHIENPGTPPHLPADETWLVQVTHLHRVLLNRVPA